MDEYEREVELIDYIEVVMRRKGLIAAVTALCGLVVGWDSLLGARQYEGQALVVISQPIASTRSTPSGEGVLGTEIQVSGLAAQTYEALAKSDELIRDLRDSLLAMPQLSEAARSLIRDSDMTAIAEDMLSAELMKETEKAESPLLAFHANSSVEDLPVELVNLWTELFVERHRGLSSNVADDYYQWVQGQFAIAKTNLEATEDNLRELTTSYGDLNILENEIGIKTELLDTDLSQFQRLSAELEAKERELTFTRQRVRGLESQGTWVGYLEANQLPGVTSSSPGLNRRSDLVFLRRDIERAIADSGDQQVLRERAMRDLEANSRDRLLQFERETGILQVRRRVSEADSTLVNYRKEVARLNQEVKVIQLDLEVYDRNLAQEPEVQRTAKAIVDDDLWRRAGNGDDVDARLQLELGKYRLVSESINPVRLQLSKKKRELQINHDRAVIRNRFLISEIPALEETMSRMQPTLDTLAQYESEIMNEIAEQQGRLQESLARRSFSVNEQLFRKRGALSVQRQEYIGLKEQEELLSTEVASLGQLVTFEKGSFETLTEQVRGRQDLVDSLARRRRTLEREERVYQETFNRFSSLLEEARIAREQAAGDIQIVSRAVVARPVPRGTEKKAAIAMIVGLMGSVMLVFLLAYVARAREEREKVHTATA